MSVSPYPARGPHPTARMGAALAGTWDNLHSWHDMGGGSSEASENTAVHTMGRDPAPLCLSSVPCFICMPPPLPSPHFFNLHHGTSLPGWPVPLQTAHISSNLATGCIFHSNIFFCFIKILTVNTFIRKIEQVGNTRWGGEI